MLLQLKSEMLMTLCMLTGLVAIIIAFILSQSYNVNVDNVVVAIPTIQAREATE
jgi:hypothetical protein